MLLENPKKASTSEPGQMGICLNSLDPEPKTRVHEKYVGDLLFADDVAITTHTQEDLQRLLDRFSDACRHFGLTNSLAKTQVMGQDIKEILLLFIHNYKLEVVHEFVYLGLPSQTTCPSTVNSIRELGRLP